MSAPVLRVAGVGYLNAAPLLCGLEHDEGIELFLGPPCEVARRLAEGEADVALLPVAAAATIGELELLELGVVARGPVRSVVVVGERPLEEVSTLALDASSRTSVVLARLEMAARNPARTLRFRAMPPAEAIAAAQGDTGALVIGDPAIDLAARFPFSIDLGEAWRARTGLPFVFAAWAAKRGTFTEAIVARLRRAADEGHAAREAIADTYAAKRGEPSVRYRSYLEEAIHHRLGAEERAGLTRFFADAAAAKLLPPVEASSLFHPSGYREARHAVAPPEAPRSARRAAPATPAPSCDELLERVVGGGRLSAAESVRLYRDADFFALGLAADAVRRKKNAPDVVTYIVDRNVNYTNVCTTSCRFCAFYRPVGHEEGYVLSREVLGQKLQEVVDAGGVQILLQGGLNPALRIEWYEDLFRWMKSTYRLGLHALSPEEILHLARLESLDVATVLRRLHAAGLDSVPGGGAEVLVDRVRKVIAKTKCTSDEWLSVMRTAHHLGLRSSATMMYGTIDTPEERMLHLIKVRDLQDETGGFTAFFGWDFQYEKGTRIAAGDHGTVLYLRTQAMARLVLDNVDHVGSSWVTQGPAVGQLALRFGADDWGSVMFEENVVSSAGTTFRMDAAMIEKQVRDAGFRVVRRNVRYDHLGQPT
jgi:cyclic dehypoxanthinyl futalosine synthase